MKQTITWMSIMVWAAGMAATASAQRLNLIPAPKQVTMASGQFTVTTGTKIFLPANVERPEWLAAHRLQEAFANKSGVRPPLDRRGIREADRPVGIDLTIQDPPETAEGEKDAYALTIDADGVQATGASASGLFNAIQTLIQLANQFGSALPALEIVDSPDFAYRGFYHDVTRGKVPKLETFMYLADTIAGLKMNQMQFYIEHTFAFDFDPDIGRDCSPITPEEVLELDRYCRDRRIDLVPSIQSFGHLGQILSLPQYRRLAEVETDKDWEDFTWHERMAGLTIDINNPEAQDLLAKMYDEFLPLFSSKFVNVCSDETYDLGQGKNKALAEAQGKGRLYLQHIAFLNELSHKHGKRMMFWGDIVKHYPDLVPEIPKDAILLDWGYDKDHPFEKCKVFSENGLDLFICPGTSGWNRILNGITNADLNIRRYAVTGKRYGAKGILTTDWGDYGHYNLLAGSLHPIAVGAAMAWNVREPSSEDFDRIWNTMMFDDPEGRGVEALRAQSWIADRHQSWRGFLQPLSELKEFRGISDDQARQIITEGEAAAKVFEQYATEGKGDRRVNAELRHASLMNALYGEKILLARALAADAPDSSPSLANRLDAFANRLTKLYIEYEQLWRARNKESNLRDIRKVMRGHIADAKKRASELRL